MPVHRAVSLQFVAALVVATLALIGALWTATASDAQQVAGEVRVERDGVPDTYYSYTEFLDLNLRTALQAGDTVSFARGHTYPGTLDLRALRGDEGNPITFGAYGPESAADPVLTGLEYLNGWVPAGDNLWKATCFQCSATEITGNRSGTSYTTLNLLVRDGEMLSMGRWPNLDEADAGYHYWEEELDGTFTFPAIAQNPNVGQFGIPGDWENAELVTRTRPWILDRRAISGSPGAPFSVATDDLDDNDRGYFVQNHTATLDREGEWSYETIDSTTAEVTLYSTTPPADDAVQIPAHRYVLYIRPFGETTEWLTFTDIDVVGGQGTNINVVEGSHITFDNVDSYWAGDKAIDFRRTTHGSFVNGTIRDALGNGLVTRTCDDCSFRNNRIFNIATIAGMGQGGESQYLAARIRGNNSVFNSNTVERVGYHGVTARGSVEVTDNLISDFNRVKTDGAGVYGGGHGGDTTRLIMTGNTIRNAPGSLAGIGYGPTTHRTRTATHGIYLDDSLSGEGGNEIVVRDNTIYNVGAAGINLHNTEEIDISNNVIIDAQNAQLKLQDDNDDLYDGNVTGNRITNNWFGTVDADSVHVETRSDGDAYDSGLLNKYAVSTPDGSDIDDNTYCRTDGQSFMRWIEGWPINRTHPTTERSFEDWQGAWHDPGSNFSNTCLPEAALGSAVVGPNNATVPVLSPLSSGSSYYVRFDVSSGNADLTVSLGGDSTVQSLAASVTPRQIGVVLTPTTDDDDAILAFALRAPDGSANNNLSFTLANIEVYEIGAATSPPPALCGLRTEAEDANLTGDWSVRSDVSGASNGAHVGTDRGDGNWYTLAANDRNTIEFCIDVETAGTYALDVTAITPSNTADSIYVAVDDAAAATWHMPQSLSWAAQRFELPDIVAAGRRTLTIHAREDEVLIDAIELVPLGAAPTPTPTATPVPVLCLGEPVTHTVGPGVTFNGGAAREVILGTAGADEINSGGGDDVICGGGGNDTINAGSGNDKIDGGDGNDTLFGVDGNDSIYGGAGDDTIRGLAGADVINGGSGADLLKGDDDNDTIHGGAGDDEIHGGAGADTLNGVEGDDESATTSSGAMPVTTSCTAIPAGTFCPAAAETTSSTAGPRTTP